MNKRKGSKTDPPNSITKSGNNASRQLGFIEYFGHKCKKCSIGVL